MHLEQRIRNGYIALRKRSLIDPAEFFRQLERLPGATDKQLGQYARYLGKRLKDEGLFEEAELLKKQPNTERTEAQNQQEDFQRVLITTGAPRRAYAVHTEDLAALGLRPRFVYFK